MIRSRLVLIPVAGLRIAGIVVFVAICPIAPCSAQSMRSPARDRITGFHDPLFGEFAYAVDGGNRPQSQTPPTDEDSTRQATLVKLALERQ